MTILQTILAALNWNIRVDENFAAVSPAGLFGKKHSTTTGLTLGYYGGILDGVSYSDGTHLLTASTTRYVVAKRSDGVVSSSTATTNWDNTTDYYRMGIAVVGTSTITTWTDWREFGAGGAGSSFTGGTLTSALNEAPAVTIASAATMNIGAAAANSITVSGTTTVTAFDTIADGAIRRLVFNGAVQLTHNATSLILPGATNITTAAGDVFEFLSLGAGNWRCIDFQRASGSGSGTVTSVAASGGVETSSGSAITATGTVRASTLVNAQTGTTYTYDTADRGKLVTHSNASSIAATLPQATGTFPSGWFMRVKNKGAGTLTITPTTSTIEGAATLVLTTGQWAMIVSDGTNYQADVYAPSGGGGGSTQGKQAIPIMAGAMRPSLTAGCGALTAVATSSNQPEILTLNFDPTTQEYAQFSIVMPKKWNEGTITFKPYWSHAATTTNFGVVWSLQAVACANDDPIGVAFGTVQTSTDTGGTTDDIYVGPESAAITVAGTPGDEELVFFRVSRVTADGSDTMAIDARLHGIAIYVTTNADTDA